MLKNSNFRDTYVNIIKFGIQCLELLLLNKDDNNNNNKDYDIIILDTHLPDISGFEVAKKIRDKLPNLRIILTTTYSLNNIENILDSIGIKDEDVFQKPFSFSELISVIEEQ